MKKKWSIIAACLLILICAIGLAACNGDGDDTTKKFKVNFISDGVIVHTVETAGNETIILPDDPSNGDFVFEGWYWDEGTWERPFTAESLLSEKLTSDMRIYAKFTTDKDDIDIASVGLMYTLLDDGTYEVDIGKCEDTEIIIPASHEGKAVTSIGKSAFRYFSRLTSIVIPDSITTICEEAFYGCDSLSSIKISSNMTTIGEEAFYGCSALTSVVIPDSVATIGGGAFQSCSALSRVDYSGDIGGWCAMEFGDSGSNPLRYAQSLYIDGINVTEGELVISETATRINAYAFYQCDSLTSVVIGSGVLTIGEKAFYHCDNLTSVEIYDSVTTIGTQAFRNCSSLKSTIIGSGVTTIDGGAFYDCGSLESIAVDNNNTAYASQDGVLYNKAKTEFIHIPKGIKGDVIISERIEVIDFSAFYGRSALTSVEIPDGVTKIGDYAFSGCSALTSIVIPDSVTTIGKNAFYGCDTLTSIVIPDSVTTIGEDAFSRCPIEEATLPTHAIDNIPKGKLQNVIITSGDTIFGELYGTSSFALSNIKSVVIPDSVTKIDKRAFYNCLKLESIVLGSGVTTIGDFAFYGCDALSRVEYKGDLEDWYAIEFGGVNATPLSYAHNLYIDGINVAEGELVVPNVVTKINAYAFSGCSGITSVIIPDTVTTIGRDAFSDCPIEEATLPTHAIDSIPKDKLQNVIIISGDTIGDYAFYNSKVLTSIIIPDSVTTIGERAFFACDALIRVEYKGDLEDWCAIEFGGESATPLSYAHNLYIDGINVAEGELVVPNVVTKINAYTFSGCSGITSVIIPDTVTTIGRDAFSGCPIEEATLPTHAIDSIPKDKLQNVIITSGDTIGDYAFYNSKVLTSIVIPDSVTTIGRNAFYGCAALTKAVIPDSVTTIGESAFYGCDTLTSIVIPDSVTTIGRNAFARTQWYDRQQYGLVYAGKVAYKYKNIGAMPTYLRITLKEGTLGIADGAFYGCNTLISVSIPNTVTRIGDSAFSGCAALTNVEIPNSVTTIGDATFSSCYALTKVVIPDSVTTIGESAFAGCEALAKVVIPDSVTTFAYGAFGYCYALKEVHYKGDVASWCTINFGYGGANPLDLGGNLYIDGRLVTDLVIPNTITKINDSVFNSCNSLTSVVISDGVTTIGESAFYGCKALTSIVISDSVTTIGRNAFTYCSRLTSITFNGTIEQWQAISKGQDWNSNTGNYTITCTDGTIRK